MPEAEGLLDYRGKTKKIGSIEGDYSRADCGKSRKDGYRSHR